MIAFMRVASALSATKSIQIIQWHFPLTSDRTVNNSTPLPLTIWFKLARSSHHYHVYHHCVRFGKFTVGTTGAPLETNSKDILAVTKAMTLKLRAVLVDKAGGKLDVKGHDVPSVDPVEISVSVEPGDEPDVAHLMYADGPLDGATVRRTIEHEWP
jgi:hypothetical protein